MNNKARIDDWRVRLALPIFGLIDVLLKTKWIATRLFNSFRTRENVRSVLMNVYSNVQAVDDELVELICAPGVSATLPMAQLHRGTCMRAVDHLEAESPA
jgi:hypothetical protein